MAKMLVVCFAKTTTKTETWTLTEDTDSGSGTRNNTWGLIRLIMLNNYEIYFYIIINPFSSM